MHRPRARKPVGAVPAGGAARLVCSGVVAVPRKKWPEASHELHGRLRARALRGRGRGRFGDRNHQTLPRAVSGRALNRCARPQRRLRPERPIARVKVLRQRELPDEPRPVSPRAGEPQKASGARVEHLECRRAPRLATAARCKGGVPRESGQPETRLNDNDACDQCGGGEVRREDGAEVAVGTARPARRRRDWPE